jgi:hypothetical protein
VIHDEINRNDYWSYFPSGEVLIANLKTGQARSLIRKSRCSGQGLVV